MVRRDNEGHCIMVNGSIYQEHVTFINIYSPNNRGPKHIKQKQTNKKIRRGNKE